MVYKHQIKKIKSYLKLVFKNPTTKRWLTLAGILLLIAAIPLTVYVGQQEQDIRQHADSDAVGSALPSGYGGTCNDQQKANCQNAGMGGCIGTTNGDYACTYPTTETTCRQADLTKCQSRGYSSCKVIQPSGLYECGDLTRDASCNAEDKLACAALNQGCSIDTIGHRMCATINNSPVALVTLPASSCTPRPNVNQTVSLVSPGILRVDISGGANLQRVDFSSTPGVEVFVTDGGPKYTGAFSLNIPSGASTFSFYLHELTACTAGTANYNVMDGCGAFPKFAGSGPTGWQTCAPAPTATPTPTTAGGGTGGLILTATAVCSGMTSQIDLNFNNTAGHTYSIESSPALITSQIPGVLTNRPIRLPFGSGAPVLTPGSSYSVYIQDHTDTTIKSNTVTVQAADCSTGTPTVPTNTPTPSPTPVVSACSPRPNVDQTVALAQPGVLNVQVTANNNTGQSGNVIKGLNVTSLANVSLVLNGKEYNDPGALDFPAAVTLSFQLKQKTPGQAGTAQYVLTDNCGTFEKFAGAGVDGWGPSPTPTAPPATMVNVALSLPGIGTPSGNPNPRHPSRPVFLSLIDANNIAYTSPQTTVTFDQTTGLFKGSVNVGLLYKAACQPTAQDQASCMSITQQPFTTGNYIVKVTTPQFLRKQIPGIVAITASVSATLPQQTLASGDINGDNSVDILDYNILYNCYGSKSSATACSQLVNATQSGKDASDLNDDGNIDGTDYNLFVRSLAVKEGD